MQTKQITTARFWSWVNGDWVKLSVRAGQTLNWGKRWSTDEGWSSEYCSWELDGNLLIESYGSDGVDCDGRLSTQGDRAANVNALAVMEHSHFICSYCGNQCHDVYSDNGDTPACSFREHRITPKMVFVEEPRTPDWQDVRCAQRDYAAEAMGY